MSLENAIKPTVVLVVEDEALSRKALVWLLESAGYAPMAAESGERALRMIKAGYEPTVALVDFELPGMNGSELIQKLQKSNADLLPVLITANTPDEIPGLSDAKTVRYLRKPLDFPELLILLTEQQSIQNPSHLKTAPN